MTRALRVALTETKNAYAPMPARVEDLGELRDKLHDVREANLRHHIQLAVRAAKAGAQVIGFGELFTGPYFALRADPMWFELAEDAVDGPTVSALRVVAREQRLIIVAPIYELCAVTGKQFNTAVVIDETGEVLGKYRKTHIPQGANEQGSFHERAYYEASDGRLGDWPANLSSNPFFPVFETSRVRLGIAICYDRHFGGALESLARNGAELVLCPAVTFGSKSRRLWDLEFPVDAARQRVFIGGSNRRGSEPPWNQEYFGASYFVGPEGVVPPIDVAPNLIVADLDLETLKGADPSGWSLREDARPEIYFGPDAVPGTDD